jgi:putative copper export protein
MTLTFRHILSGAFWLVGMALLLLADKDSANFASLFSAVACLALSVGVQPRDERVLAERGPSIPWDRRDSGEKFSIIMFHIVIAVGVLFTAGLLAGVGGDAPAPLWRTALGMGLVTMVAWQFWRNWTKRNAG